MTLHTDRMMESPQRQPFVVGVVMVVMSSVSRNTRYLPTDSQIEYFLFGITFGRDNAIKIFT